MSDNLSLEHKIGRMLIGRLPGTELTDSYRRLLADGIVGGIAIFKDNVSSLEQIADLIHDIVAASKHVPILCIDQEGGAVQRLDHVISPLPSAMSLAATFDDKIIAEITAINARQLAHLGFNCLFAPVLDVVTNPLNQVISTRAFGNHPALVGRYGRIVAETISGFGLVPVGKHFPGHGSTSEDSHLTVAVNHASLETLWQQDLLPFKQCLGNLPAIMMSHVWLPAVDETPLPASLSTRVTSSILRDYLGYTGLIFTDDMTMRGLTDCEQPAEAALSAIQAGADLLLACCDADMLEKIHTRIYEAVNNHLLGESRLQESIARIDASFCAMPRTASPQYENERFGELSAMIDPDTETSFNASLKGIALVKGEIPTMTAKTAKTAKNNCLYVISPKHNRYEFDLAKHLKEESDKLPHSFREGGPGIADTARSCLFKSDPQSGDCEIKSLHYELDIGEQEAKLLAEEITGQNVIFITFRCAANPCQQLLTRLIAERSQERLAVISDSPYDEDCLTEWPNIIATHDPSDQAMKALSWVLLSGRASGMSPIRPMRVSV